MVNFVKNKIMYWRKRNIPAIYTWLFAPFTPRNEKVVKGDNMQQVAEKLQGQIDEIEVGSGGMDKTVYDPANRAEPVAFESDLDELRAITTPYPAVSFEIIQGGDVTGTIEAVQNANDGNTLRVNESAGGLTVDFTFSGVQAFNVISLHMRYAGGANHMWEIQLWNFLTNGWDVKGETEGNQDYLTWFNIVVPEDNQYLNNGTVKVRFYHLPNFITAHFVLFDYVAVVGTLTAASLLHNQLEGRDAANAHPATAIGFVVEEIPGAKTIQPADSGKHFFATAAADFDVTLNAGLTHPISIFQKGNGVLTVIAGSGVTLLGDVKTGGQNLAIAIVPESTTVYEIIGGVA